VDKQYVEFGTLEKLLSSYDNSHTRAQVVEKPFMAGMIYAYRELVGDFDTRGEIGGRVLNDKFLGQDITNLDQIMKLIYIGSPYSHPDDSIRESNYQKVSALAAHLCSKGDVCFSPITYGHTLIGFKSMPTDWAFWKNFCISFLSVCEELIVYKMTGWEDSKGLGEEISFARDTGIKVTYMDYKEPKIRELSRAERNKYVFENVPMVRNMFNGFLASEVQLINDKDFNIVFENVPTKLIAITYGNETIESYE